MVRHFLKDGTEIESVSGKIIKETDFKELYNIIRALNTKIEKNGNKEVQRKNEIWQ